MNTEPETATWSSIADWYDNLLQTGSGPHEHAVEILLRLSATAHDSDVLDIACGQGHASRALARAGARSVTGADLAPEMIAAARRHEADEPLGIEYLVEDATTLHALPDAAFDLVTCQLGLMDIPDLTATLIAVHRVLRAAGAFVFVIGHPCFLAPDAQTVMAADGRPGPTHHRLPARAVLDITKPPGSPPSGEPSPHPVDLPQHHPDLRLHPRNRRRATSGNAAGTAATRLLRNPYLLRRTSTQNPMTTTAAAT